MDTKDKKVINLNILVCSLLSFLSFFNIGVAHSVLILIICFSTLKIFGNYRLTVFKFFGGFASFIFIINVILFCEIKGSIILPISIIGTIIVYQLVISLPTRIRK